MNLNLPMVVRLHVRVWWTIIIRQIELLCTFPHLILWIALGLQKIGYADLQTTNMNIITALLAVVLCKTIFGTMYSCESARTKAYSNNLRWRMVYQRCMLGLTYEEVASRLSVDPSTVWRVVQRFEEHGTVDSCYTHEGPPKTLTALDEFIILEAVTNRPAIYLPLWNPAPGGADNWDDYLRVSHLSFSAQKQFFAQEAPACSQTAQWGTSGTV